MRVTIAVQFLRPLIHIAIHRPIVSLAPIPGIELLSLLDKRKINRGRNTHGSDSFDANYRYYLSPDVSGCQGRVSRSPMSRCRDNFSCPECFVGAIDRDWRPRRAGVASVRLNRGAGGLAPESEQCGDKGERLCGGDLVGSQISSHEIRHKTSLMPLLRRSDLTLNCPSTAGQDQFAVASCAGTCWHIHPRPKLNERFKHCGQSAGQSDQVHGPNPGRPSIPPSSAPVFLPRP